MKKWRSILLWVVAFLLAVVIGVYQRMTGPTYPLKGNETIAGKTIVYKLLRSAIANEPLTVEITATDSVVKGFVKYKRFKTNDDWTTMEMSRQGEILTAQLPGQPSAGKLEYTVGVTINNQEQLLHNGQPVVARFRGAVPTVILIVHIIFMFAGIILALRTGMESLRKDGNYSCLVNWTLGVLFVGGMILGPIVQKYAFGDFWTGFPFGTDLTDNKTLIAIIFWVLAFFLKNKSKWWVLLATVMMVLVYLIPHSLFGSELDYESGKMRNKYTINIEMPGKTLAGL